MTLDVLAALITGRSSLELREFAEPTPRVGVVVVDIALCGICGTDVHAYQSGRPYAPAICGHEWTGTVSAIGPGVRSTLEGKRVVVAVPPPCGACRPCRRGQTGHCQAVFLAAVGMDAQAPPHGGFAPRIAVSANRVVAANPALTDGQAAQVEPATVTFHAVRRSGLRLGDIAVVQGAGPIGLLTAQWVRAAGAGEVIVIEPSLSRRALATALGTDFVVAPGDDAEALVKERTRGLGVDIAFECAGRPEAIQAAVGLVRRGGEVCLVGFSESDATIVPASWLVKEITVTSALAYGHEEFELAMGMMADGRVSIEGLATGTVGLAALGATFADLASGSTDHIKVLVDPRI